MLRREWFRCGVVKHRYLGTCEEPTTEEEDYLFWEPSTPLEAPKGEVRGVGASPGIVRGRARVAVNLDKALELAFTAANTVGCTSQRAASTISQPFVFSASAFVVPLYGPRPDIAVAH